MSIKRAISHVLAPLSPALRTLKRSFPEIENAISTGEGRHSGQICFAVEPGLELGELVRGVTSRQRAEEVFAIRRVWDTAANNGVLIYLLLADRRVEIVADRGICEAVAPADWQQICRAIEDQCRAGDIKGGILSGVDLVARLLIRLYPLQGMRYDTVSDRPVVV